MSDDTNPKDRLGLKKVPLSIVPMVVLVYLALAFAEGARKYGEFNWRRKAVRRRVYLEAILRHCIAALAGEDIDADSGLPHEAKIAACCAIILDAKECGNLIDDRFEKDAAATMLASHTAGDYHASAEALTRTPARTLDEIAVEAAERARIDRSWSDAATADRVEARAVLAQRRADFDALDAGREFDQAGDQAVGDVAGEAAPAPECNHHRLTRVCPLCSGEVRAVLAQRPVDFDRVAGEGV